MKDKPEPRSVAGIHAPPPRPTPTAALLLAGTLSVAFLGLLGLGETLLWFFPLG